MQGLSKMADDVYRCVKEAGRCLNRKEDEVLPHIDHPEFMKFSYETKMYSISYVSWGISTSNSLWDIYSFTTDIATKNILFEWWLSQHQEAPGPDTVVEE